MKANSEVLNVVFGSEPDCILVNNFQFNNQIKNIATKINIVRAGKILPSMVGVWLIKKLNNNG